jgi:hypothetical protein
LTTQFVRGIAPFIRYLAMTSTNDLQLTTATIAATLLPRERTMRFGQL